MTSENAVLKENISALTRTCRRRHPHTGPCTGGSPKGKPNPQRWALRRTAFPRAQLAADLETLERPLLEVARGGGVGHSTLWGWLQGTHAPRAQTLGTFLDLLGIDRSPYETLLVPAQILFWCDDPLHAGSRFRSAQRGELAQRAVRGFPPLPQREDGAFVLPCGPCGSRHRSRPRIMAINRKRLEARVGKTEARAIRSIIHDAEASAEDREAANAEVRTVIMAPLLENREQNFEKMQAYAPESQESHTYHRALSLGLVIGKPLTRPFFLCPLCGRVSHAHRWHDECWAVWRKITWPGRAAEPPPLRQRGPSPEKHLLRNYDWLRRLYGGRNTRRELLDATGFPRTTSETVVTEGIKAFIKLLPGSWDLVFSPAAERSANQARQRKLVRLPHELRAYIEEADQCALIRRLDHYGMTPKNIARLTGAPPRLVREVIQRVEAEGKSA